MDVNMQKALLHCETDIKGSIQRFFGNEEIYILYLNAFTNEPTMQELKSAIESESWEDAFIAAHALKGLAANLGFIPLYHATGQLILILRSEKYESLPGVYEQLLNCYNELIKAINTK